MTTAQEGGKVVSLTHRPHLPQEILLIIYKTQSDAVMFIIKIIKFVYIIFVTTSISPRRVIIRLIEIRKRC